MLEGSRCAPPYVGVGEIVRVLCVGVGTVLGLGWRSCCLVCHGCWVSGTICCSFFVDACDGLMSVSLVCCGCLCCLRTV